ncbi:dipeptidase PepV [Barrientosiimonas marina]|uniref:Dipeptidase PepV n=1 Tax=Lentibacillus kimchii TaxID=1542911 RepID=A0ABW2UTH7_9BACI
MDKINWMDEVVKRQDELLKDLQGFLSIKSVLNEEQADSEAPLGQGVKDALHYMLNLGDGDGFSVKNVDNLAGHLEMGEGEEMLGILGHADVVPEGDGWSMEPYGATIKDGRIYARGSSDDKGPTIAAYYGMKIVKELGVPLDKRIRLIIGTDEESDWRGVNHYFAKEEMPDMGFVPDAEFPIIFAEKGLSDFDLVLQADAEAAQDERVLQTFQSGLRYNMVPDHAEARITAPQNTQDMIQSYQRYLADAGLDGQASAEDGEMTFTLNGVSAHGAEPANGINAGIRLAQFLQDLPLDASGKKFLETIAEFRGQTRGEAFNMAVSDDVSGDLTMNAGVMQYTRGSKGRIGVNMRYPVTFDMDKGKETLTKAIAAKDLTMENMTDSKPAYVEKDDPLVQTLKQVYEEQTGETGEPLAIGGGTYARALDRGVAFGAMFPGREDVMHQKDEYAIVDDLLKTTAIYAQAIYELAKAD